jgi:signal transduction histidine kinase
MSESSQKRKDIILKWYHWAVLLGSLLLTVSASYISQQQIAQKAQIQFESQARYLVDLVSERMVNYEEALWAGVAMMKSHTGAVTRNEWKVFTDTFNVTERFPGINGIGVIKQLDQDNRQAYLAWLREEMPTFEIHPQTELEEYWPIIFIEPQEKNLKAVGLDMAHETNRFTAAKKARDTRTPQITGPITLVQDSQKTPGFLFYVPWYDKQFFETGENEFKGLVYAPFIMSMLMEGTLTKDNRQVLLSISDQGEYLYNELDGMSGSEFGQYKKTIEIDIYGRDWSFDIQSTNAFSENFSFNQPYLILLGGLVLDALLIFLFYFMAKAKSRSDDTAKMAVLDLEKSQDLMKAAIYDSDIPVVFSNSDGKITYFNRSINRFLGDIDEQSGFVTLLNREGFKSYSAALSRLSEGETASVSQEYQISKAAEQDTWVVIYTTKVNGADFDDLYVNLIVDISDQKRLESELEKRNKELDIVNRDLNQFAYIASHDLKEPLRTLTTFSSYLVKDLAAGHQDRIEQDVHYIEDASKRMSDLVTALLEFSRSGNSDIRTVQVNLVTLLEEIQKSLKSLISDSGAEIQVELEVDVIHTDQMLMKQVLQNLISNAIKFVKPDQAPKVLVRSYIEGRDVVLTIQDNGIGIEEQFLDVIFSAFKRLHSMEEYPGTGIGLSIVKRVIDRIGGDVMVESSLGEGTCFIIKLPNKTQ